MLLRSIGTQINECGGIYRNFGAMGRIADPLIIFGSSRLMWWHDASDIGTLFQDSTFSTPVAALNDPMGGVLDKSKGLVRGSEIITNGDFSSAGAGWSANVTGTGTCDFTGGICTMTGTSGNRAGVIQTLSGLTVGQYYEMSWSAVISSGNLTVGIGTAGVGTFVGAVAAVLGGVGRLVFAATATTLYFTAFVGSGGGSSTIDNISIRELPGNHAFQATSASRPLWKQDGNGCFNGLMDGVDDSWATAAIDLSASDKIAVFAAVRKLSDASLGVILESSSDTVNTNGSFGLFTKNSTFYRYAFNSRGTVASLALTNSASYDAPITNVLTGIADISGDSNILRVNGVQVGQSSGDQGTGNFGNFVLNIGSRGGSSTRLNGAFYQSFGVIGPVTASEIAAAEAYLNSKCKAY